MTQVLAVLTATAQLTTEDAYSAAQAEAEILPVTLSCALDICDNTQDEKYVIYFQAFTNTYGDTDYLCDIYTKALSHKNVAGISIGTRRTALVLMY